MFVVILTKEFGILGTACAMLISNSIKTIVVSRLSQFFYFIAWPFKIISIIVFINLLAGIVIILFLINFWYFIACIFFITSIISISYYFWNYALNDFEREIIGLNFKIKMLSRLNL
jgi:hypothetical protein